MAAGLAIQMQQRKRDLQLFRWDHQAPRVFLDTPPHILPRKVRAMLIAEPDFIGEVPPSPDRSPEPISCGDKRPFASALSLLRVSVGLENSGKDRAAPAPPTESRKGLVDQGPCKGPGLKNGAGKIGKDLPGIRMEKLGALLAGRFCFSSLLHCGDCTTARPGSPS